MQEADSAISAHIAHGPGILLEPNINLGFGAVFSQGVIQSESLQYSQTVFSIWCLLLLSQRI